MFKDRETTQEVSLFLKKQMLPLAIATGIISYIIYDNTPSLAPAGPHIEKAIHLIQPALLFLMLFLSFCKISPRQIRIRKWHTRLLLFQSIIFLAGAAVIGFTGDFEGKILLEGAILCIICPTATAAAVVTGKLGGDIPGLVTYTILINIVAAILIPLAIPLIHPSTSISFMSAFLMILSKVFPLLIAPCLCAFLIRYVMPGFHKWLLKFGNLAFYLWGIALTMAIAMTTKSIIHSSLPLGYKVGLGAVSLASCMIQFAYGRKTGRKYGDPVTAGQSLGQKNTVFAIWVGYTFMTPVSSVAAGFYCIWHNLFNSWQLNRKKNLQSQS